jgi:hypothetical protein
MNLLEKYKIKDGKELEFFLMCLVLSDTTIKKIDHERLIISSYSIAYLAESYDDARYYLGELAKKKKLRLFEGCIIVGNVVEGVKSLYCNQVENDAMSFLRPSYVNFLSVSPQKEATINDIWKDIKSLSKNCSGSILFVKLFTNAYYIVNQESHRPLQAKEHGQMTHFLKLFEENLAFRLVCYYVANAEKFGDSTSIGNLLYRKDAIYESYKKHNLKRTTTEKRDDGDF